MLWLSLDQLSKTCQFGYFIVAQPSTLLTPFKIKEERASAREALSHWHIQSAWGTVSE